jgi:hypothetical protein
MNTPEMNQLASELGLTIIPTPRDSIQESYGQKIIVNINQVKM